jgi:hypothetical protein
MLKDLCVPTYGEKFRFGVIPNETFDTIMIGSRFILVNV